MKLTVQQELLIYPIQRIDKIQLNLRQLQPHLYHSVHRHALGPPVNTIKYDLIISRSRKIELISHSIKTSYSNVWIVLLLSNKNKNDLITFC